MRRSFARALTLLAAAGLLTGCAADVVMVNARTGETAICRESLRGINPWSQKEACIGHNIAAGWVRTGGD